MPVPLDESDYTNLFNTPLSAADEAAFQQWAAQNPRLGNTYDYDARGFWKAGAQQADNGHGSDQFKKPNHPTFSDQSQYSGVEGMTGGQWVQNGPKWTFVTSPTNELYHEKDDLQKYFNEIEPGNSLVYGSVTGDSK